MTNKVKLLIAVGVVAVVIVVLTAALINTWGDDDKQAAPAATSTTQRALSDAGLEFVPLRARCGVPKVGNDAQSKTPQGTYCVVMLTVKNVTDQPKTFPEAQQRAIAQGGTHVTADPIAGGFANGTDKTLTQPIAPHTQVAGYIVFDVPKGTTITNLELHGEPSSAGVTVPFG